MKKIILFLIISFFGLGPNVAQIIPFGLSKDSVDIPEIYRINANQSFYLYKPLNYDSISSPIWFVIHGTGGTGAGSIGNLSTIADRRGALMVGLTLSGWGTTMIAQSSMIHGLDSNAHGSLLACVYRLPGTITIKRVYDYIKIRENRISIPSYLSGFSSGGQFVSRYMLIRQAYPDSVPIQMAISMSPFGYSLPTDSFLGVAQPWECGMIMPLQPIGSVCPHSYNIYGWNCNEHIIQYYNENYAVCVGELDLDSQINGSCYDVTGITRLDRARTFFTFCDSNAVTRGTTLNWQYAEIPGAGHDEYSLFQTKWLPTDSSTIAESILFDTPYNPVPSIAPVAFFYPDSLTIQANDTVFFNNVSVNATSYYWEFGDSTFATSTLTNPYHVYSMPGTYSVELTAMNATGCDNWFKRKHFIHVTSGVGLDEISQNFFIISPNPNDGTFTLQLTDAVSGGMLYIYTMERKLVYSKLITDEINPTIHLPSSIAGGMYILQLQSDLGFQNSKLLLNK
ncbi:MAG: PKD domain-containing protein [Bacteroidia bacterium]